MHLTHPYPIQLMASLEQRVAQQTADAQRRLADLLRSETVTVDTIRTIDALIGQRRAEALALLSQVDTSLLLGLSIRAGVRDAERAAGIPELRDRIGFYETLESLWGQLEGLPSRHSPITQLDSIRAQIEELRSAGGTEAAIHQRSALRAIQVAVPVLGREDVAARASLQDELRLTLDMDRAELQRLLSQTPIILRLTENLVTTAERFGLKVSWQAPPALPEPQAALADPADGAVAAPTDAVPAEAQR